MNDHIVKPVFFEQFSAFLDTIPRNTPANTLDKASSPSTSAVELLQNYLAFYDIDYVAQGVASSHDIWQSEISGFRIVEQRWQPLALETSDPRTLKPTTLLIAHGYFDHTGLFGNLIHWGLSQGFVIHCFDLPGHGLSSGEPAAIDSFDQYSQVLSNIIQRENDKNYCLVGQSTGCSVVVNYLLNRELFSITRAPEKVVLLAPLVRSIGWQVMRWPQMVVRPFVHSIKRHFHSSSNDREFAAFLRDVDPLQAKRIPLSWLGAMDKWYQELRQRKFPINSTMAPLIIQGTADTTVDFTYNIAQLDYYFPHLAVSWIDGARHQLVNESDLYWGKVARCLQDYLVAP